MKKKIIKIIVSMELIENIIFLFIQHESNCWYSAKKNQHLARLLLSFSSQLSMNQCSYICVCPYLFLPKSHWKTNDSSFFSNAPLYFCVVVGPNPIEYLFSYLLYCIFAISGSVGSLDLAAKTHNSPIYTASLLIHIRII